MKLRIENAEDYRKVMNFLVGEMEAGAVARLFVHPFDDAEQATIKAALESDLTTALETIEAIPLAAYIDVDPLPGWFDADNPVLARFVIG